MRQKNSKEKRSKPRESDDIGNIVQIETLPTLDKDIELWDFVGQFEFYKSKGFASSIDSIITVLSAMSAGLLAMWDVETESYPNKVLKGLDEFAQYYELMCFSEELEEAMFDSWGWYPRVLDIGYSVMFERHKKERDTAESKLKPYIISSAKVITEYILNKTSNGCILTINVATDYLPICFSFDNEEDEGAFALIYGSLLRAAYYGGSVIIREITKDNKYVICGFSVEPCEGFTPVPSEQMQSIMQIESDGSQEIYKDETYITPNIILPVED